MQATVGPEHTRDMVKWRLQRSSAHRSRLHGTNPGEVNPRTRRAPGHIRMVAAQSESITNVRDRVGTTEWKNRQIDTRARDDRKRFHRVLKARSHCVASASVR